MSSRVNLLRNIFSYNKLLSNKNILIYQTVNKINALHSSQIYLPQNDSVILNSNRFKKLHEIQFTQLRYKSKNRSGKDNNVNFKINFI